MAPAPPSYCAEQVRRHDNDRFICDLFAPPAERDALLALHAFNLELARVREAVREPLLGHIRLRWWADTLDAIFAGRPPDHQVAAALSDAIGRFAIDRRHLDRIVAGRAFDLEDRAPETVAALLEYAEATSAALSLAGLQVMAADSEQARAAARDVGIAWAVVGLIRAVPFHARARRIYLPADLSRSAGLDAGALFDRGSTSGVAAVVRELVAVAEEHLQRGRGSRRDISRRALPVLLPATLADLYIGRLRRADWDPFQHSIAAPAPGRLIRAALARLRCRY
jgi:NADH dehydrogenase [ubiquinone] 1 alpha subcomplex assembly factor 6